MNVQVQAAWNGKMVMVQMDDKLAGVIEVISKAPKASIVRVHGHVSGISNDKCLVPEIADRTVLVNFDYLKFKRRKGKAIHTLNFNDVKSLCENIENAEQVFEDEKAKLVVDLYNEFEKSERSIPLTYAMVNGVKVNLESRKGLKADGDYKGKSIPTTINGEDWQSDNAVFSVKSVMLPYLEVKQPVIIQESKWEASERGNSKKMSDIIDSVIGLSYQYKTLSLGLGNFDKIAINHNEIFIED